ncbi:Eco57I restriction-modification methylase domain-containing protein [Streptomyces sp. NPDC057287]|uniref:Eco57I restriction-modification methylase domain-containing protein n=1 Tax=Streptomyces sp. NPDC057287 TaxID=3346086 RepID=UPI003638A61F
MTFDSLVNEGEYFPSFYLDEILPKELRNGPLKEWASQERQGQHTPRQGLRDLARPYFDVRSRLAPDSEKYQAVPDARAAAALEAATTALKDTDPDGEPPAFQPAAPRTTGAETSAASGDRTAPDDLAAPEDEWRAGLADWHRTVLRALGFTPSPGHLTLRTPTGPVAVPVAHSEPGIAVLTGGFAEDLDATRAGGHANRLPAPVRVAPGKTLHTVTDLAAWLLTADDAPGYVLLLFGGVIVLGDRDNFAQGRYLAVDLGTALPRKAAKGATAGEIDLIAAVFGAPSLRPGEDGAEDDIARLVAESRDHSVGVTAELRVGLQKSVQLIANEVLGRARKERNVHPEDLQEWLPETLKDADKLPELLTKEALRYLYRILFLLYAEARPELEILPVKSDAYATGYSIARLRELVVQEKLGSRAKLGYHFHESLALLFDKVFHGHPTADTLTTRDAAERARAQQEPELLPDDGNDGLRIEALRSRLFDPASIKLVGQCVTHPDARRATPEAPAPEPLDLRLRNEVLHQVLRHLTLKEGRAGYRGGFISYANLSINHLGAVYEGLMSYTGFIAKKPLYEVAKGGDPSGGSWLIDTDQVASQRYPDEPGNSVFVKDETDRRTGERESLIHPVGSYVYRMSGRDRQTSASYYTPESLTQATVEQALRFRLDDKGAIDPKKPEGAAVKATDVLHWRVCEPALGSGAFLNEAVNQLAALYLRLAERDRQDRIDPEAYQRELQKAKAYIALHNAYGVDLNDTAVELAEISLWLNTMYPGMKAPWYGLHLHRGNSLIGASRKVYGGQSLIEGGWLTSKNQQRPRHVPLGEKLPGSAGHQSVHQFLLPALGWGSVLEEVSLRKPKKGAEDQTPKSVVAGTVADWLEPELVEAMKKWRSVMRRAPKGDPKARKKAAEAQPQPLAQAAELLPLDVEEEEESGQGALDLGLTIWKQPKLAVVSQKKSRGLSAARREAGRESAQEEAEASYQTGRLRALALRVEYLWDMVVLRLKLSEKEISRSIDVWGADPEDLAERHEGPVMDRDAVLEALRLPGTPYWRLKQIMDAWCALWFWPLEDVGLLNGSDRAAYFVGDKDLTQLKRGVQDDHRRKVALTSLDDWLEFAEAVVGRVDADAASLYEVPKAKRLEDLDRFERNLDSTMVDISAWAEALDLGDDFPWFDKVQEIAEKKGFLHWELDYAHVFTAGGFDLMVGNPPWVRQEWDENGVLAEIEPWFVLGGKEAEAEHAEHVAQLMRQPSHLSFYLSELETVAGVSGFLSSPDTYPELVGTRPDMYRAFMLLAWRATGERGVAGLIHPSTHLTGSKEGVLRKAAYRHLRLHADFVNELYLFAKPVDHSTHFSVNVYGHEQDIHFQHLSWLLHPQVLTRSLRPGGSVGDAPGIKHLDDQTNKFVWDLRPHRERVITVTHSTLSNWRKLAAEEEPPPVEETKLLFPVTKSEESAIVALAGWSQRLGGLGPRVTSGFNEKTDRTNGYFTWESGPAGSWNDVILQGPFFGIATPFAKRPVEGARTSLQMEPWNSAGLAENEVPRTNYRPAGSRSRYVGAQDRWVDYERLAQLKADPAAVAAAEGEVDTAQPDLHPGDRQQAAESLLRNASTRPYAEFIRVAWRRQIATNTERSLFAAIVPPGPAHVDLVNSMALSDARSTVLAAGFMSALPLDYYLRITGRGDLRTGEAKALLAPTIGHPLAGQLLLRVLRLNCQTDAYASLWRELYDVTWSADVWAAGLARSHHTSELAEGVTQTWYPTTPLRTEFERRAALVEIDALVAVWLGISADELIAMYQARFPVLQQYEENMWFDATGRRITNAHQVHGYGQSKDAWKQLSSHDDFPLSATVPDGYTGPLYRADRKREMRSAHEEFTRRLRAAGWEPGDSEPPTAQA